MTGSGGCEHDLTAEYIHPRDTVVLDVVDGEEGLEFTLAVPCPDCDQTVKLGAAVNSQTETELELPLDDATDTYD
jgi:hypothetical protein